MFDNEYNDCEIVLVGAASCGHITYDRLKLLNKKVVCFLDNNPQKHEQIIIDSVQCYLPENFISESAANTSYLYIICTGFHLYDVLKKQLNLLLEKHSRRGKILTVDEYFLLSNADKIEEVCGYLDNKKSVDTYKAVIDARLTNDYSKLIEFYEDVQYFCLPEMKHSDVHPDEVFVDCGAFVGDTIEKYLFYNGYLFNKIYAFEPGQRAYRALLKRTERLIEEWGLDESQIQCVNKGIGNVNKKLYITSGTYDIGGSHISESGDESEVCEICTLDSYIKEKICFLKADIEGFEIKMLEGARNLICEYKPKIAICIYHSPFDLFYIAKYIKQLVPEYKMQICHHSISKMETVLYCYT